MPTPMPNEFMSLLYSCGAAIYQLPPSPTATIILRKFQQIAETFSGEKSADTPGKGVEKSAPEKRRRGRRPGRATASVQIAALVSTKGPMTAAQITRSLSLNAATVNRYLKTAQLAGKMVPEGKKYRWVGDSPVDAVAAAPKKTLVRKARAAKATGAAAGEEKLGDRILHYLSSHDSCTKNEIIQAMKPARPNHVGIAINRLYRGGHITSQTVTPASGIKPISADGPYSHAPRAQQAA